MGTLYHADGEWKHTLEFNPSNPCYPPEVFLAVMEHETAVKNLHEDHNKIMFATTFLAQDVPMEEINSQTNWEDFRRTLLDMFGRTAPRRSDQVDMLKSLTKGRWENPRHFLIRARHVASSVVHRCISSSSHPLESLEALVKLLFVAGLSDVERAQFPVESDKDLESLIDEQVWNEKVEDSEELGDFDDLGVEDVELNFQEEDEMVLDDMTKKPSKQRIQTEERQTDDGNTVYKLEETDIVAKEEIGLDDACTPLRGGQSPLFHDTRLPPGWKREVAKCNRGINAGRLQVHIVHPSGQRFTKKRDLRVGFEHLGSFLVCSSTRRGYRRDVEIRKFGRFPVLTDHHFSNFSLTNR